MLENLLPDHGNSLVSVASLLPVIISVVCSVVAALIVGIVQGRIQLQSTSLQLSSQKEFKQLDIKEKNKQNLITKLEAAHILCSQVAMFNSKTKSFIELDGECSSSEWDDKYQLQQRKLDELQMLIELYFPDLKGLSSKILGASNCFWGAQRNLMYADQNQNTKARDCQFNEIHKYSEEVAVNASRVQQGLSRYSANILAS